MRDVSATTVTVVPWYERKDFDALRPQRCGEFWPSSYDEWLDSAFGDMRELLSRGCALKIVTIHLDDYVAWLSGERETDSECCRTRYIEQLARVGLRPLDWPFSTASSRTLDA